LRSVEDVTSPLKPKAGFSGPQKSRLSISPEFDDVPDMDLDRKVALCRRNISYIYELPDDPIYASESSG
jgi:hypothetical protein